jgi:hypothetical protein
MTNMGGQWASIYKEESVADVDVPFQQSLELQKPIKNIRHCC